MTPAESRAALGRDLLEMTNDLGLLLALDRVPAAPEGAPVDEDLVDA